MKSISDLLRSRGSQSPLLTSVVSSLVVEAANDALTKIIGDGVRKYAQAVYLKQHTLTFACLSSVIAQEIKIHEKDFLDLLNKKFGPKTVEKINYLA